MKRLPGERGGAPPVPEIAVATFDPALHVSPYTLHRRLVAGAPPRLVDLRPPDPASPTFSTAEPGGAGWRPAEAAEEVVLFDDDGRGATARAAALRGAGFRAVRALYGGVALYDLALDPLVVGASHLGRGRHGPAAPC